MNKNLLILIGLIIIIFFIGCDDTNNFTEYQYKYPLSIGNQWEYNREYLFQLYSDSTCSDCIDMISGLDSCSVNVVQKITLLDSIKTIQLNEQVYSDTNIIVGLYFYQERDTGLFQIAYQNSYFMVLPKRTINFQAMDEPLMPIHLKKIFYNKLSKLSKSSEEINELYFQNPPVYVLKYPIEIGSYWLYKQENYSFRMDREVIGDTTVIISAGTFDCYVIRMNYKIGKSFIIIDDYIANEGLVLRKIKVSGETVDRDGNDAYALWNDEYRLMNYINNE